MVTAKIIAAGIIAFMGVSILHLWERNQDLKHDLALREDIIDRYKKAAETHKKYVEDTARIRRENETLRGELADMEGGNAPLSNYLGSVAGKLWK